MAWRVMMPKKISTRFIQDPKVGVKCIVTLPKPHRKVTYNTRHYMKASRSPSARRTTLKRV
jgi:hypothetical protein